MNYENFVKGMMTASKASYENVKIEEALKTLISKYNSALSAEQNLFRYNNGLVKTWMVELGEETLRKNAAEKANRVLNSAIILDKVFWKETGKHCLPVMKDSSFVMDGMAAYESKLLSKAI